MIRAMKSVEFRNTFKNACDKATDGEIIVITRPKGGNVILLSEVEYNRLRAAREAQNA